MKKAAKNTVKSKKIILLCSIGTIICIGVIILIMTMNSKNEAYSGGTFIIELYPEYAPKTVENFVKLAESGFYDGLTFHRIADGFVAQGGDPNGDGTGGSGKNIEGEFASNGFTQNTLKHTKGVISMARSSSPNSASSQFFIMLGTSRSLDGDYAAFGKVIEGMEVVEAFQNVERVMSSLGEIETPVKPVIMKKVTVLNTEGNPKIQIEMK